MDCPEGYYDFSDDYSDNDGYPADDADIHSVLKKYWGYDNFCCKRSRHISATTISAPCKKT